MFGAERRLEIMSPEKENRADKEHPSPIVLHRGWKHTALWWCWAALLFSTHCGTVSGRPQQRHSAVLAFAGLTPHNRAPGRRDARKPALIVAPRSTLLDPRDGRQLALDVMRLRRHSPVLAQQQQQVDPENEDDGEDYNGDDVIKEGGKSQTQRGRKRRIIKDWLGAGNRTMVKPIRMEDGSIIEDPKPPPERMQTNFDKLFRGMPGMNEILSGPADETSPISADESVVKPSKEELPTGQDDLGFEDERKKIEERYRKLREEAMAQLDQLRQEDPEGVPDSSQSIIESVLKEEMEQELAFAREKLIEKTLEELETERLADVEKQDLTLAEEDETVQKMIKDAEAEADQWQASQAEVDSFNQYQEDAMRRAEEMTVLQPENSADLDKWALDQMQGMRASHLNDTDVTILDNLEDTIEELQARIEAERDRGLVKPETMKEWQMYRAIASRLGNQTEADPGAVAGDDAGNEEAIASQLQSWREFQEKEEEYRRQSGLARGIKMPFEWQEPGKDPLDNLNPPEPVKEDDRNPAEIRAELNQKALEAMEDLRIRRQGTIRSKNLEQAIEALKKGLEEHEDEIVEEDTKPKEKAGPVDLSDVFPSRSSTKQSTTVPVGETDESSPPTDYPLVSSIADDESEIAPPPPPDTPFFSSVDDDDSVDTKTSPPPDTPFFATDDEVDSSKQDRSKLGSLEEQKLRSMYQRAGARTSSEQEELRIKWEEYQKFEQEKRKQSGLSDEDVSLPLTDVDLGYDISDVVKDGGDIDAEKVLASIGPRPTRNSEGATRAVGPSDTSATNATSSDEVELEAEAEKALLKSTLDPEDVSDQLYRAVSAVGGGRTRDDPDAKAKEKASFKEYLRKEEELRHKLEDMDDEGLADSSPVVEDQDNTESMLDDIEYAENVLESIGPRPEKKPKRALTDYERDYSDRGGALADEDDEDEDDEDVGGNEQGPPLFPDWLRKERGQTKSRDSSSTSRRGGGGFLGSEVFEDDEEDFEKNMRQVEEFERRRASGRKRQMGIDISDVLGRSEPVDYAYDDYYAYGRDSRSFSSFDARKDNLLEYTELNVQELNSLMDHKESPYATGVSQYMKKISKPFREFGALFRLEGVLIDLTGFQYQAWQKVAKEYGFKPPELEDARRAAVTRPEIAVRKIFFWSDDLLVCRDVAAAHRVAAREVFSNWMKEQNISASSPEEENKPEGDIGNDMLTRSGEEAPVTPLSEKEILELQWKAWTKTAELKDFSPPSLDEILFASVISPDDAVREAFGWTSDASLIQDIVSTYRKIQKEFSGGPVSSDTTDVTVERGEVSDGIKDSVLETRGSGGDAVPITTLNEKDILEIQFMAWERTAEEYGLVSPTPEEVTAAMVINDPLVAVRDGFGWTEDPARVDEIVGTFRSFVKQFALEKSGDTETHAADSHSSPASTSGEEKTSEAGSEQNGPTQEELLEMQVFSWTAAAEKHGFESPPLEELQLAMNIGADEAIKRLFRWTEDEEVVRKIVATYQEAQQKISEKYIQKYKLKVDPNMTPAVRADKSIQNTPSNDELFQAASDAWTDVAKNGSYELPSTDQVLYAMTVGAEDAILSGFQWTTDPEEAKKIAQSYVDTLQRISATLKSKYRLASGPKALPSVEEEETPPFFSVVPGAAKWVKSLLDVDMPCAIVSYLDREQVDVLLEQSGLSNFLARDKRVTASDGYGRESQQMLGAALRVERRPDHCVVFDTTPESAAAAHDVEMKCVDMIGIYPMYDLLSADSTARYLDQLSPMYVRRLFGERIYDEPMLDMQQTQPDQRRKVKTRFWEEGDRL